MEQQVSIQNRYLWIHMPEELDHNMADQIRKEADAKMLQETVDHIVFDFSKTRFMDSSGIGFIVGRYKKMQCLGGKVIVVHASRRIQQMLSMAGLKEYVHVVEERYKNEEQKG